MCNYSTYHSDNMKRHIRRHTGDKPFKCAYCPEFFSLQQSLKWHILTEHPGKSDPKLKMFLSSVVCQHCNQTLPCCTDTLLMHIKTCDSMLRESKQSASCILCEYETSDFIEIKRHIETHIGEKPRSSSRTSRNGCQVANFCFLNENPYLLFQIPSLQ
uniref:RE1-silencing transcription factor n=1 Tax=Cacopsylla melanoneura TaxID=428564 RepID=A0A8D8Q9Z4_9HEMI